MKKILFLIILILIGSQIARSETFDYESIDIDGAFAPKEVAKPKKVTASDRMKVMRAKLEARNMELLEKKIEDIRINSEIQLMKQLQKTFDKQLSAIENL